MNGTVGFGGNSDGPYFGIIELTFNPAAVPEPASAVLLGAGGLAVAAVRRRRGRA